MIMQSCAHKTEQQQLITVTTNEMFPLWIVRAYSIQFFQQDFK